MRRSTVLSLPLLLVFPDLWTHAIFYTLVTIVKIVTSFLILFQLCNFDLIYVVNSGNTTVKNCLLVCGSTTLLHLLTDLTRLNRADQPGP
jgi:hypothetical protein